MIDSHASGAVSMLTQYVRFVAALCIVFAMQSVAQSTAEVTGAKPPEHAAGDPLEGLVFQSGPTAVVTVGNATLTVPPGFLYLDAENTSIFLERLGESSGGETMIATDDLAWKAFLVHSDFGYVEDTDALGPEEILAHLMKANEAYNAERRQHGWPDLRLVGWAVTPSYNARLRELEWAGIYQDSSARVVNHFTYLLSRHGVTTVTLVTNENDLPAARNQLKSVLRGYSFRPGDSYSDFQPGDKVAGYGLAGLMGVPVTTPIQRRSHPWEGIPGVVGILVGTLTMVIVAAVRRHRLRSSSSKR
jgi:uncharacterized membrane-anchored protein